MNVFCRAVALMVLLTSLGVGVRADTFSRLPDEDGSAKVAVVPVEGFNLELADEVAGRLILKITTPTHNWFACTLNQLATDRETILGFSLTDNDTLYNKADVTKWRELTPLMSYCDPLAYESYEWFTKDAEGRWVSGDSFKSKAARSAGTGKIPQQTVLPSALADSFLAANGKSFSFWRPVDQSRAVTNLNIFRIAHRFARPTATIAMRVPYEYSYLLTFLGHLRAAKVSGINVDDIGVTPEKRSLYLIRVETPLAGEADKDDRPTVLIYAREHATEMDSSWAVEGLVRWLASDDPAAIEARRKVNWLLIPLIDPDAAAHALFKNGNLFKAINPPAPEAMAYGTYLVDWLDKGHRIDLAVNLHNVECTEGPHVFAPMINRLRKVASVSFNSQLFAALKAAGYQTGDPEGWKPSLQSERLAGWCYLKFRTVDVALEFNSRYPSDPLEMQRLQQIGVILGQHCLSFVTSPEFAGLKQEMVAYLAQRAEKRTAWWTQIGHTASSRTMYDLLTMGY